MPKGNPQARPGGKLPTSFHLTPDGKRLLKAVAEKQGLTQAGVLETLIRREAKREGLE